VNLLIAILCIVFFGAVLLLVILNHASVDVNLFFRDYQQLPVAVVMVASLLVGIAFTAVIAMLDGIRLRLLNRRLRKEVTRLEKGAERLHGLSREGEASGGPAENSPAEF